MCWKPTRNRAIPIARWCVLDESSKQLIIETRAPIPAKPGRHDYEYERNGVANIFMMFSPLEGWRRVKVTDRRAAADYGQVLKELSDTHFPSAEKIVLVKDNLSTHRAASLYAAFPAAEARRLAKRFEWHYTPKHGSWLDMAESELAVLTTQCLSRRIPNKQALQERLTLGRVIATSITPRPIGNSQPTTPASNSKASTPNFE
jgi:DDE superfamily endonuclease